MNIFKNKKTVILYYLIVMSVITFYAIVDKIIDLNHSELRIKVEEKNFADKFFYEDSVRPVIKEFSPTVKVMSQPELKIDNSNFLIKLFAPNELFIYDILYSTLILLINIIFIRSLLNIDLGTSFPQKLSASFKISGIICLTFWGISILRTFLINEYIMPITNDLYMMKSKHIFLYPEFLIGCTFIFTARLLNKGEALQKEQDLTI